MVAFQVDAMFTTSWVHFASAQAHVGPIWTQFGLLWNHLEPLDPPRALLT